MRDCSQERAAACLSAAFLDGWGINAVVGDDSAAPFGGAAFHDVRVRVRRT
jgi:hypothetical protein